MKFPRNGGLPALVLVSVLSSWTVSLPVVFAGTWTPDGDSSSDAVYSAPDFLQPVQSSSSYSVSPDVETFWSIADEDDLSGKENPDKKDKFGKKEHGPPAPPPRPPHPPPPHPPPKPTTTTTTTTTTKKTTTTTKPPPPPPPPPPPKHKPVHIIPKPIYSAPVPVPAPPVIPLPYPSPALTKAKIKKMLLLLLLGSQMFRKIMSEEEHNSVADLIRDYDTGKLDELERILWDSYQQTGGAEEDISAFLRHLRDGGVDGVPPQ